MERRSIGSTEYRWFDPGEEAAQLVGQTIGAIEGTSGHRWGEVYLLTLTNGRRFVFYSERGSGMDTVALAEEVSLKPPMIRSHGGRSLGGFEHPENETCWRCDGGWRSRVYGWFIGG